MVFDTIAMASENELMLKGLKKIRFKKVIKPGDRLIIKAVKQKNKLSYSFTVNASGIHACKGTLIVDYFNKT
jgi:3-hydroxymyristoyl/3-hydroxydecanoyl-(acyl carrier protein) dehydratase